MTQDKTTEKFSSLDLFELWKSYEAEPKVRLLGDNDAKKRTEKKLDIFKESPSASSLLNLVMSDIRIDLVNKAKLESVASLHFAREKLEDFKPFEFVEKKFTGSLKGECFVWAGEIYVAENDNATYVNSLSGEHYESFKEGLEGEPMYVFGANSATGKSIADFRPLEDSISMIKKDIKPTKKKRLGM